MNKSSIIKTVRGICAAVFGVALVFCTVNTVHAEEPVKYWDANKQEATCETYKVLDSGDSSISLETGFYVVKSDVTITELITVDGAQGDDNVTKLILCDGARLIAKKGIYV